MKSKIVKPIQPELKDSRGRTYSIEEIQIERLDYWNSPTQIPNRYDGGAAMEYAALMKEGKWDWKRTESYPVVFKEVTKLEEEGRFLGERIDFWIGDGHHTIEGGDKAGLEEIPCTIYLGTQLDAKLYSFREANRYHGVRLSNAQKREIVVETLTDRSILTRICEGVAGALPDDVPSERLIAIYLNDVASAPTVGTIWDSMLLHDDGNEAYPWLKAEKRLGQDGKRQVKRLPNAIVQEPLVPHPPADVEQQNPVLSSEVENLEPIAVDVDRQDALGTVIDEGTSVEVENLEPIDDEEIEVLTGFEAISRDFIKVFARKHSRQISDDIAHHFNLDDKSILYDNVFSSIVKTLINYREEVQRAL